MHTRQPQLKKPATALALAAAVALGSASPAHATANATPAGSTLSGALNELAIGSTPWTDFLASIVQNIQGNVPGPLLGSSGAPGSSGIWDWNLRPYK